MNYCSKSEKIIVESCNMIERLIHSGFLEKGTAEDESFLFLMSMGFYTSVIHSCPV